MTITKIVEVPTKLPYASLYLDDVEEISQVLLEAYTPKEFMKESLTYELPDSRMDSLDDLERHGGSTSKFKIKYGTRLDLSISSFLPPELRLYSLPETEQWATFGRIKAVFDARQHRLKNAVAALPQWLKVLLYVILIAAPTVVSLSTRGKSRTNLFVGWVAICLIFVFELFRPSRVYLFRYRDNLKKLSRERRQLIQQIFVLVLVAILGAILGHYVPLLWRK